VTGSLASSVRDGDSPVARWDDLSDDLAVGHLDDDELTIVLSRVLPRGAQMRPSEVEYRTSSDETALTLKYRDGLIISALSGPAMTPEIRQSLLDEVRAALSEGQDPVILRAVLFSRRPIEGMWRFRDNFQILPAPPEAPRPGMLIADHPFVIEFIAPGSADWQILRRRWARRTREIALLLNLIIRYRVTSPTQIAQHHWTITVEDGKTVSRWAQDGYALDGFTIQAPDWTPPGHAPELARVDRGSYFSYWPSHSDTGLVPDCMGELLSIFEGLAAEERLNLLRTAYWYHLSGDVWRQSQSLHLVSLVNAIEVLADSAADRRQPRAPTRKFLEFMREFAPGSPSRRRLENIYDTRGQVSHGGRLLGYDGGDIGWGLNQQSAVDREVGDDASWLCGGAILNWLWAQDQDHETRLIDAGVQGRRAKPGTKSVAVVTTVIPTTDRPE